jgi:hypothetical protein
MIIKIIVFISKKFTVNSIGVLEANKYESYIYGMNNAKL